MNEEIIIGLIAALIFTWLIRPKKKPEEYSDILKSDKYKVKGKFES